jgi:AraC family transcriptional regulator
MHAITHVARKSGVHAEAAATLEVVVDGTLTDGEYTLRHGCAIYRPAGVRRVIRSEGAQSLLIEVSSGPRMTIADPTARAWSISLIQELQTREPGWQLIAEGLVMVGLGRLTRIAELSAHRPLWLDEAVGLARRQLPLPEIARRIGRHPSHVAREFHRHEGVTVGEFVRRCRLELAARALQSGRQSIGEVALDAGFCDQSHFTNAFRRVFGVTPGEWR